ncbi:Fur family transcriptional regulator, partial [Oleiphilus sp. HI0066]|uniref:Fur family transcriptional regulator n=2 Tax=Oleiphilus TaxID=141450 RepID=UPI000B30F354
MSQINKIINSAEQQCKAKGVRLTDKRKQVLSALIESKKALSAYELVDYLKDEFKAPLPAMSVYRILDFLQTEQLVHKLD